MSSDCRVCKRCGENKPILDFYKHPQGKDGYDTKCKECVKKAMKQRHYDKYQDPEFVERERARGREKYKRLNYLDRSKELFKDKPWKDSTEYKGLRKNVNRHIGILDSETLHHYDYNKINCFFILDSADHRQAHTKIDLDIENRCFIEKETGELLDSLTKHMNFLDKHNYDYGFAVL